MCGRAGRVKDDCALLTWCHGGPQNLCHRLLQLARSRKAEVRRFLVLHPEYPRNRSGEARAQRVTDLPRRPIYAGS
jgi:hypothetical protein